MKPNITLAETRTPNGARMTLVEQDGSYCVRVNGQQLMHSAVSASEVELGRLACENVVRKNNGPRVLVGGLGLGFTLKSVLAAVGGNAVVHVSELMPEIVAWNRTFLTGLNGGALTDRRVSVLVEDVRAVIRRAAHKPYDVIALDIDNGTTRHGERGKQPALQRVGHAPDRARPEARRPRRRLVGLSRRRHRAAADESRPSRSKPCRPNSTHRPSAAPI
ncbi:MAG: hypothetical protein WDM96_05865 [Lacunisphaera sp.]